MGYNLLPFINKKNQGSGLSVIHEIDRPQDSETTDEFLETCIEQLIHAIHSKDVKAATFALKVILEKLDSSEPTKGPSPHTYDAQNKG